MALPTSPLIRSFPETLRKTPIPPDSPHLIPSFHETLQAPHDNARFSCSHPLLLFRNATNLPTRRFHGALDLSPLLRPFEPLRLMQRLRLPVPERRRRRLPHRRPEVLQLSFALSRRRRLRARRRHEAEEEEEGEFRRSWIPFACNLRLRGLLLDARHSEVGEQQGDQGGVPAARSPGRHCFDLSLSLPLSLSNWKVLFY